MELCQLSKKRRKDDVESEEEDAEQRKRAKHASKADRDKHGKKQSKKKNRSEEKRQQLQEQARLTILADTLSARRYEQSEHQKRRLRDLRRRWRRDEARVSAEMHEAQTQQLKQDRDALLALYQQQIDLIQRFVELVEEGHDVWGDTRLREGRQSQMAKWLKQDRKRLRKLQAVHADIETRYSDTALGLDAADGAAVADAVAAADDAADDAVANAIANAVQPIELLSVSEPSDAEDAEEVEEMIEEPPVAKPQNREKAMRSLITAAAVDAQQSKTPQTRQRTDVDKAMEPLLAATVQPPTPETVPERAPETAPPKTPQTRQRTARSSIDPARLILPSTQQKTAQSQKVPLLSQAPFQFVPKSMLSQPNPMPALQQQPPQPLARSNPTQRRIPRYMNMPISDK